MNSRQANDLPETDIVLWGATGFIGKLLAAYVWRRYGATNEIRFALGGNQRQELESVHRELNADDRLPMIVGDAFDQTFLDEMAEKAKLIVSTVGPYARLGSKLVAACAAKGTDYCDLAGEPQWIYRMINAYQKAAESSGARIVHACGFDSIPSDMGVWFLQQRAKKRFGHPLNRIKMRVTAIHGGASGGTVDSILNIIEEVRRDPEVAKILRNPYALAPEGMRSGIRQPSVNLFEYDADVHSWVGPFIMAAVNTRIVHRTNALMNYPWGSDFKYDEALTTGPGLKGRLRALALSGMMGAFIAGGAFRPTRDLLKKTLLPRAGSGPSPEKRKKGFYKLHLIGKDWDGHEMRMTLTGDRDPGYGSTRKMLGEAAVCLFKDIDKKELGGGFWTPASAMGDKLIRRLTANAGLTFAPAD